MNVKSTTAVLCAAALMGSAHGLGIAQAPSTTDEWTKYPSSYPFENEGWMPEMPPGMDNELDPEGLPDVGGYVAQGIAYCNAYAYFPYGIPAGMGYCGKPFQRFIYVLYSIPLADVSPFNCTASAYVYQGPITGSFGSGPSVCEPEVCCSEYYGSTHPSTAWTAIQDSWDDRYEKYYCDWYNYDMYCAIVMWQIGWCLHQYARGAIARTNVLPCYQGYTYFIERCKSFKQVGGLSIVQSAEIEPDAYLDTISPQQINVVMVTFWALDRVCLPASHYNPELLKEEEAAEGGGDAEGGDDAAAEDKADDKADDKKASTPASSSSDSSNAVVGGAPFMLFASMASFFTLARFL